MEFLILLLVLICWSIFWFDSTKLILLLEFFSSLMLVMLISLISIEFHDLLTFIMILVWLVCESSLSFVIFILHISISFELVSKLMLTEL